jgi:hypothetical protein
VFKSGRESPLKLQTLVRRKHEASESVSWRN